MQTQSLCPAALAGDRRGTPIERPWECTRPWNAVSDLMRRATISLSFSESDLTASHRRIRIWRSPSSGSRRSPSRSFFDYHAYIYSFHRNEWLSSFSSLARNIPAAIARDNSFSDCSPFFFPFLFHFSLRSRYCREIRRTGERTVTLLIIVMGRGERYRRSAVKKRGKDRARGFRRTRRGGRAGDRKERRGATCYPYQKVPVGGSKAR